MTTDFRDDVLTCPLRGSWCSFQLVDEHGDGRPYAGLTYKITDEQHVNYEGYLNEHGYAKLKNLYCGNMLLDLSAPYTDNGQDDWYKELITRKYFKIPLTALQVAAEQTRRAHRAEGEASPARENAKAIDAQYFSLEVRDFLISADAKHLPNASIFDYRPSPFVSDDFKGPPTMDGEVTIPGVPLYGDRHHILEIKALRAYSPLLSRDKAFCALNAYQLALMSLLSYGPFNVKRKPEEECTPPPYYRPESIGYVLGEKLPTMVKPTQFSDGKPFHLLCEEVPYSKRLEIVPYDPERYTEEAKDDWKFPEQVHFLNSDTDTQAFITHNDKVLLISVRGTQEFRDILRDADARQVPNVDGHGQAHRGFYNAFISTQEFIKRYFEAFYTGEQTIIITAHSLGGAIATLMAEWIRREYSENIQLYTFGSPRVGDKTFVREARELTHHRLINNNDPVPGVPSTWMDAEWKVAVPGVAMLIASKGISPYGWTLTVGGLVNLQGDDYQHHGDQRHFMPRKADSDSRASILWQPKSAMIELANAARFAAQMALEDDMPERESFIGTLIAYADHMLVGGYGPAALANLLRWRAAAWEREGQLFTAKESAHFLEAIDYKRDTLQNWLPGSYLMLEENLACQPDARFSDKSTFELRSLYDQDVARLNTLKATEDDALRRARKRLKAQADYLISREDVFGDALGHEQLDEIVEQWLAVADVQKAQRLVKAGRRSSDQSAWA